MLNLLVVALSAAIPATAPAAAPRWQERVAAVLRDEAPGTRFGLLVVDGDGQELAAIAADERFVPASNTKIATTAAAFALLSDLDRPDPAGGTRVRLEPHPGAAPDVVLEGRGDAQLSSAPDCRIDCLAILADAVAARTRRVRDVVGDDSWFPDQRWSPGMSWNTMATRSGTAVSALTLDDNEATVTVAPGPLGRPPAAGLAGDLRLENRAVTVAAGAGTLAADRAPGTEVVRLTGTIAATSPSQEVRLGLEDPARHAAWTLRRMLAARGVTVTGTVSVRHRPPVPADDPDARHGAPAARAPEAAALARLTPPPLGDDLTIINKTSQNLHAELMLRRLGRLAGSGSIADGAVAVRAVLARAGVARAAFDLFDGAGMSTYNRLTPRAVVTLLRWIDAQPWGVRWWATLPVAGDAGLRRFAGTPLAGRLVAKTGTLNAAAALSGHLVAASGRTLTFSLFANDMPAGTSATKAMDDALELVAAAN